MLVRNPSCARRIDMVVVIMKSGIARVLGKRSPRPPLFVSRWVISFECSGRSVISKSVVRNLVIIALSPGVSSPSFQVGHVLGS